MRPAQARQVDGDRRPSSFGSRLSHRQLHARHTLHRVPGGKTAKQVRTALFGFRDSLIKEAADGSAGRAEMDELRTLVKQLATAIATSEDQRKGLQDRVAALIGELSDLQAKFSSPPAPVPAQSAEPQLSTQVACEEATRRLERKQ